MKVPDISRVVISRLQLRELNASGTREAEVFDRAGNFLKRSREAGFNAVVLDCGGVFNLTVDTLGDQPFDRETAIHRAAVSEGDIRRMVDQAHQLDMLVVLDLGHLSQMGESPSKAGMAEVMDWHAMIDRALRINQTCYEADGVWINKIDQSRLGCSVEENLKVRDERLAKLGALVANYPATLLVLDGEISGEAESRPTAHLAPNVIFADSFFGTLRAGWRLEGMVSIEDMDGLASALCGSVQEIAGQKGRGIPPYFVIGDLPMDGFPPVAPHDNILDSVFAALILTAPGIPILNRFDDLPQLTALLELRQNLHGTGGGLQGNHIRIIHKNDTGRVLAYLRWNGDEREDGVIVMINFSEESWRDYTLGLPIDSNWQLQLYSDASNGSAPSLQISEEEYFPEPASLTLDLAPYSYLVLTRVR